MGLEYTLDPELEIQESVCDDLSNELVFLGQSLYPQERLPYMLSVPCRGNPSKRATFKLVAAINTAGDMITFGIGYDPSGTEEILQVAAYGADPQIEGYNSPLLEDPHTWRVSMYNKYLAYQHLGPEVRLKKTKCAAPTIFSSH